MFYFYFSKVVLDVNSFVLTFIIKSICGYGILSASLIRTFHPLMQYTLFPFVLNSDQNIQGHLISAAFLSLFVKMTLIVFIVIRAVFTNKF